MRKSMYLDMSELEQLAERIQQMAEGDIINFICWLLPKLQQELIGRAKLRTPVNSGDLRKHWQPGEIRIIGDVVEAEVINDLEYASDVEYGFRSHFVPGYWQGKTFVYSKGAKTGMQVGPPGGRVPGRFMLKISLEEIERELPAYLDDMLQDYLDKHFN
ncbi:HK97 gp10 family phage protein [Paenibacillus sanguinis]|uniref:HK97 gp10 family phage protein n=1 Tax=Paenibacillus sanguinis TaxID=225906 RepID=UPI00037673B2|nr:HK97 gp10 family phage protein [Paenibacillus sanguinis]